MAKYIRSHWDPETLRAGAFFRPLYPVLLPFIDFPRWPGLADYQRYLDASPVPVRNANAQALRVVAQDGKPNCFSERYAPRIYLRAEMQTREENWHDFFQVITWRAFPDTKRVINARHFHAAQRRHAGATDPGRRSEEENLLSLFDECGAVVVSRDASLLDLIRQFSWRQLFYERRDDIGGNMECILFGHAMLEKVFKPYIGMTANAVLLYLPDAYFNKTGEQRLRQLDIALAAEISGTNARSALLKTTDLAPLPVLGFPGFWPGNEQASFYDNRRYFRAGRRRHHALESKKM